MAIKMFICKLSTSTIAKFTKFKRTDDTLQIRVKYLSASTLRSALTPDCGYNKGTNNLIGEVYCPKTKCSDKTCLPKNAFQCLSRSDYQFPQCVSVCQVRKISCEVQLNSFILTFGQGVYFLKKFQINSRCYWRFLLSRQVLFLLS